MTTTNTTPATTTARKSSKQAKREAADAKLAATQQEAPAPETTEAATGHNSNKGKQIQMNTVGPKRELAYATVGVLAVLEAVRAALTSEVEPAEDQTDEQVRLARVEAVLQSPNVTEAKTALAKHGYENLRPRAERIEELKAQLATAAAAGDSKLLMELAKRMKAIQDGRED